MDNHKADDVHNMPELVPNNGHVDLEPNPQENADDADDSIQGNAGSDVPARMQETLQQLSDGQQQTGRALQQVADCQCQTQLSDVLGIQQHIVAQDGTAAARRPSADGPLGTRY